MAAHPRTSQLVDPDLPAVATLLAPLPPSPLRVAVATAGGEVAACDTTGVTWWPGRSITVTYRVSVSGGDLAGSHDFIAVAGSIPDGAMVMEGDDGRIGLWRVPYDPVLPGLARALEPAVAARLLEDLGVHGPEVATALRAYRPGRRAVVSVHGRRRGIFLKLVKSRRRLAALHETHCRLAAHVPVPASLGFSAELRLMVLQEMGGLTLRRALESESAALPAPQALDAVLEALPRPQTLDISQSPIDRLPGLAPLLATIAPQYRQRVDEMLDEIGVDSAPAGVPVHGDFYEAQLMVDEGRIVGLLDVDTYGWGRRGDDPATMLGHLDLWRHLSRHPERVRAYGAQLLSHWDSVLDPVDMRRRTAAVLLTLAPGSFRVQSADWPSETAARLDMATRWLESARRVDERGLTSVSGLSHRSSADWR